MMLSMAVLCTSSWTSSSRRNGQCICIAWKPIGGMPPLANTDASPSLVATSVARHPGLGWRWGGALGQVGALRAHCVRIACSANTMKPSWGGREETPLHLCRCHKSLHILGDWWPWPSAICFCVSVLEDGGSLMGTWAFCLHPIGAQLVAICSTMWAVIDTPCY